MKDNTKKDSNSITIGRPSADTVRFYYVYILKCNNNLPYVGCTENLKDRLKRHNNGHVPATKTLRPLSLISYFAFNNQYTAFDFEKYLKSGSGRAFIKKHHFLS